MPALDGAAKASDVDLGSRTVAYSADDVILYALAVGAGADDLELVYERELRALPTFVLGLGLWASDELGARGGFDPSTAVHGAQTLELFSALPCAGEIEMHGRVSAVWDKGSAALLEVEVTSPHHRAVYSIFAPGGGGFGGARGPAASPPPSAPPARSCRYPTAATQAALYRLTGDRHAIHIDPAASSAIGQPRPILHGLCTLGIAAREAAGLFGRSPWTLSDLRARFTAPVVPGDRIDVAASEPDADGRIAISASAGGRRVLDGVVAFGGEHG